MSNTTRRQKKRAARLVAPLKERYDNVVATLPIHPQLVLDDTAVTRAPWAATCYYDAPSHGHRKGRGGMATLVAPDWVVTVAHIFGEAEDHPPAAVKTNRTVRLGGHTAADGEERRMEHVVIHPRYTGVDKLGGQDDIAMVRLDKPVDLPHIEIANNSVAVGDKVSILGWPTEVGLSEPIFHIDTTVIDPVVAKLTLIGPDELCVANLALPGQPVGRGYSGGPCVRFVDGTPYLIGAVSRGAMSVAGRNGPPVVLTDIVAYREFIQAVMNGEY